MSNFLSRIWETKLKLKIRKYLYPLDIFSPRRGLRLPPVVPTSHRRGKKLGPGGLQNANCAALPPMSATWTPSGSDAYGKAPMPLVPPLRIACCSADGLGSKQTGADSLLFPELSSPILSGIAFVVFLTCAHATTMPEGSWVLTEHISLRGPAASIACSSFSFSPYLHRRYQPPCP
jgi:hypothetical protein